MTTYVSTMLSLAILNGYPNFYRPLALAAFSAKENFSCTRGRGTGADNSER